MNKKYQQVTHRKAMIYLDLNHQNNQCSKITFMTTVQKHWQSIRLNEWNFTLLLFIFSLSIVIGKLFSNHDSSNFFDINNNTNINISNNKSHYLFYNIANQAVISLLNGCDWIIKAIFSGLATIGITWFIIYKDSNVPGINPPSPFNASKKRISEFHSLQINYFVGILNGLLIFLYMCF